MGKLVVLSGPSCIGKGPLHTALKRFYPDAAARLHPIVLYNSRDPRPGEEDGVDYHFRPRADIEPFRDRENFLVMDVRGDLQALDVAAVRERLTSQDAFFEGNPYVGGELINLGDVDVLSVFLSPLSRAELDYLHAPERNVDVAAFVTDVMRRKLLRRTQRQKHILSLKDLENIERRAGSAYRELQEAHRFQYVIPNHDGEDSENWDAFYYPVGDARKTLLAFADLLESASPAANVEQWDASVV